MKLAAYLVQYWAKKVDYIDSLFEQPCTFIIFIKRTKWHFIWFLTDILAKIMGYGTAKNRAFIHHCMTYQLKEESEQ